MRLANKVSCIIHKTMEYLDSLNQYIKQNGFTVGDAIKLTLYFSADYFTLTESSILSAISS